MSLDRLPDEVLVNILRLALVGDSPIPTCNKAHTIYQTYLHSIILFSEYPQNRNDEYLNTQLSQGPPRCRLAISPLLLGTCRRWYRLGCPFFYQSNTFVTMHHDLGPFAKQIGFHNSKFLRAVELTVHHQDPNPGTKVSLLRKASLKQVECVSVILARRHSVHPDLDAFQKSKEWFAFRTTMMKKAKLLRETMERQKRQGGGWAVVDREDLAVVHSKADFGVMSLMWALERIPVPPKVWAKNKRLGPEMLTDKKDAVLTGVDVLEGSVASEETAIEPEDLDASALDTGLPTPDTTPESTPEPIAIPAAEMLPLPNWGGQR